MEEFWIPLLTILTFLHQTASVGDTTEVIGAVGGSVTFRSYNTNGYSAFWSFGDEPIALVHLWDYTKSSLYSNKYRMRVAFSERGRALTIFHLSMGDAGTYAVNIHGEISTFKLQVYRELAEPRVTCEAQNCSAGSCSFSLRCSVPGTGFGNISFTWRVRDHPQDDGSMVLLEDKSSLDDLELVTCMAQNAVSSRNITVTVPGVLCSGNSTHPASLPGSFSGSWVRIALVAGVEITALLLVYLVFFCKSRGYGPAQHSQVNERCG